MIYIANWFLLLMANLNDIRIEKDWTVYYVNDIPYVGKIVGVYKNSLDVAWADFQRIPMSYLACDLSGKFANPLEAINRAVELGANRENLEKIFAESFPRIKFKE